MKIGILTFHRAHNYGAVLQCYALQEVLTKLGHNVEIIDYRQHRIETKYKVLIRRRDLVENLILIHKFPTYFKSVIRNYKLRMMFESFSKKYLSITSKSYGKDIIPQDYDVYVIGSDQLLNVDITIGLDNIYSGNFQISQGAFKIAYAISSNVKSLEYLGATGIKSIVGNFKRFSFRESQLCNYYQTLTSEKIEECVDPTLLADASIWDNLTKDTSCVDFKHPYIVLYQVRKIKSNPDAVNIIASELAAKYNYRIVDISEQIPIEDWVTLIKHAKCVITSSFHAVVFSCIFNVPFYSIKLLDGSDDRYTDLLYKLGLEDRIVCYYNHIADINPLEWNQAESLNKIRKCSLEFLNSSLTKCSL